MRVNSTGIVSKTCSVALNEFLRVKHDPTNGLAVAGAEDRELGTMMQNHVVSGQGAALNAPVVAVNVEGTIKMVASGAISQWAWVYGASAGKVSATANSNLIGVAMLATTADGDYLEVMRTPNVEAGGAAETGVGQGIHIHDHFEGDYPAKATALTGNRWTKVETDGLGVISSDEAGGWLKFVGDAVAEASTQALYMINAPVDIDSHPILEGRIAIFDIGDDAALDINFGFANDTHATDFDSITEYIAFHLDGTSLNILAQSADGATTIAAADTTLDAVDDTAFKFKIDMTDKADCKLYIDLEDGSGWQRVLASTTFDMSNATGTLTPIIHVEKTSNDTTFDVRLDEIDLKADAQ